MCSMLVSARGFRNETDSCVVRLFHVVSAHALKNEVFRLYIKEDSSHDVCLEIQIPIVNQSFDYFSICTNGTNRPFVFAWLTSQLMRCSLQMVYRSTEELTIRSNGTNRYQSTDYFSVCTNGTNRPSIFAWLTSQLMRCSLKMVYRSTEKLTIRSNGTNRNQSTDYFSVCTNGTNRPSIFAWLTSQLMRCSLKMVYRSTEKLTIRSNGTNRNQSTDYFSVRTNGTNRPFVFAWLTSQLMRCSLKMVYRSTEKLTIRSNGTNRNQSTEYFSICTNGTNRPFVFARLTSVMRCISPMEFRSN